MELVVWRDKIDTVQLHFGRIVEHDEIMLLFSMLDGDVEETFGLKPEALKFIGNGPVPIELTLLVKNKYQTHYLRKFNNSIDPRAALDPDSWQCICTVWNYPSRQYCSVCGHCKPEKEAVDTSAEDALAEIYMLATNPVSEQKCKYDVDFICLIDKMRLIAKKVIEKSEENKNVE